MLRIACRRQRRCARAPRRAPCCGCQGSATSVSTGRFAACRSIGDPCLRLAGAVCACAAAATNRACLHQALIRYRIMRPQRAQYGAVSQTGERRMLSMTDGSDEWIEAALAELAEAGIERVRVEVVAERLGVTKGGFYRRFKDRRALARCRAGDLERRPHRRHRASKRRLPAQDAARTAQGPRSSSIRSASAPRAWRSNSPFANGLAPIQAPPRPPPASTRRASRPSTELYRQLGLSAEDAQGRAVLFYAFIFGQSLLFLAQAPRKRASLRPPVPDLDRAEVIADAGNLLSLQVFPLTAMPDPEVRIAILHAP